MVKIFAKLTKNHKTVKSTIYQNVNEYKTSDFYTHLTEICRTLDIATPLVIPHYVESYENFNSVKFSKDDFVDTIPFDFLVLENIDR